MQDSSNACNLNAYIGYISLSLVCRDTDHKKTTCSDLVDTMKPQFTDIQWKKSAKYVTVDERIVQNFDPILIEATSTCEFGEIVNEIQNVSEIKDGSLYDSQSNIQYLTHRSQSSGTEKFLSDLRLKLHLNKCNREHHQS